MKILNVGAGDTLEMINKMFPDADEVVSVDAVPDNNPTHVLDITGREFMDWEPAQFDDIVASHVLEHLGRNEAIPVIHKLACLLKLGGVLHVFVPSLEWACAQIIRGVANPAVWHHLWGSQETEFEFHKWGYTSPQLQATLRRNGGLEIIHVMTGKYKIIMAGEATEAEQHYVAGKRLSKGNGKQR